MPQKQLRVCDCKPCRKMRRRGLILGTRLTQGWRYGEFQGRFRVSDYVPFRKFAAGRRRKEKLEPIHVQD